MVEIHKDPSNEEGTNNQSYLTLVTRDLIPRVHNRREYLTFIYPIKNEPV